MFLLALIYALLSSGPNDTAHGFHLEGNQLVWDISIRATKSRGELQAWLQRLPISEMEIDYRGAGYSAASAPMVYLGHDIGASFELRGDSGQYTIRFIGITYIAKHDMYREPKGRRIPIEFWEVHDGHMTRSFRHAPSAILDHTFRKLLAVPPMAPAQG